MIADSSSVIAATATTTTTTTATKPNPAEAGAASTAPTAPSAIKAGDKRYSKVVGIKKVKFSSESLKSEVEELCEQLKDSALTELNNDNIRITCHQNNNNSICSKNNNSIDLSISKMSEASEATPNETATQAAEGGERPSFLVMSTPRAHLVCNF